MRVARRSQGQAIVEFGLVILVLLLVVTAATDLGLLVAARQTMSAATTESGREVAYASQPATIISTAQMFVQGNLIGASNLAIDITYLDFGPLWLSNTRATRGRREGSDGLANSRLQGPSGQFGCGPSQHITGGDRDRYLKMAKVELMMWLADSPDTPYDSGMNFWARRP
jgi:TadE-like protein